MSRETTEKFDAIRCSTEGRHAECELLFRNQVVDEYNIEEVNLRDGVSQTSMQAYSDRFSAVFDDPVTAEIGPQGSSLDVQRY